MNRLIIILLFLSLISIPDLFSQTQDEIEQLMGEKDKEVVKENHSETKEKKSEKSDQEVIVATKDTSIASSEDSYSGIKYKKLKKMADALFASGSYINAIEIYNAASSKTNKSKKLAYLYNQLGKSNFFVRDYSESIIWYNKIFKTDKESKYPFLDFNIASAEKYLGNYNLSVLGFNKYLESKTGFDEKNSEMRFKALLANKGSKYALEFDSLSIDLEPVFKVENAGEGVNGPSSDFGAELRDSKTMVFSKLETSKEIDVDNESYRSEKMAQMYQSEWYKDNWGDAQIFSKTFIDTSFHIGNPSFTYNGKTLYFTKCDLNQQLQSICKIYKSDLLNGKWGSPEILNSYINQEGSNNTHPFFTLSEDGTSLLYFSSDRAGGKGGMDIWVSKADENNVFSSPKNLGAKINTRFDEVTPYFNNQEDILFFSSDGHPTFGGLDIFSSNKDEFDEWTKAKNLNRPLNSSLDDYGFKMNNDLSQGFIVSNRSNTNSLKSPTCCDDIFYVTPTKIDLIVSGNAFEDGAEGRLPLNNCKIEIVENNSVIAEFNSKFGSYIFPVLPEKNYILRVSAEGYIPNEIEFSTMDIKKSDTLFYDVFLSKIIRKVPQPGELLSIVYWDFDKFALRQDSPDSLAKVITLMEKYPEIVVEVGSHTDNKGSIKYNEDLSQNRSDAVVRYFISKGIPEDRVIAKAYGESQPAEENTINGMDNPEGRQLNRRTEFKVLAIK